MNFEFEEKIEVNIPLSEIARMIEEKLLEQGYKATSVEPTYKMEYVNNGYYEGGKDTLVLTGFKAKVVRV